jgi:hypothetical protein
MKIDHVLALIIVVGALTMPAASHAGQPCGELPLKAADAGKALKLGARVRDALEKSSAALAFVARVGIDLSEFGLRYSHVGVAWRDHPSGRWMTFHLLNTCGTGKSALHEQPLEDFYRVELFAYDALIAIPSLDVQNKLLRAFFGPMARRLHHPEYNLLAHPFSTSFQNSNQWLLEVTAAGLAPPDTIQNRQQAQTWLRTSGYVPSRVRIGAGRRLGAQIFSPHVHFSDHTEEEAHSQQYFVVTSDSIISFFAKIDPQLLTSESGLD